MTTTTSDSPPTPASTAASTRHPLGARFAAFVTERFPFALDRAHSAWAAATGGRETFDPETLEALREPLATELRTRLRGLAALSSLGGLPETRPRTEAGERMNQAVEEILEAADGFLRREAIALSLTADEKRELLRGMLLTRAVDNRLKAFFTGGEVRYRGSSFQGKGFRSLGQEAIYAAPLRLRRGEGYRAADGSWRGDMVAPLIRDAGAALAMHPTPETVRMILAGQMGKPGSPMDGRDLHMGDFERGILPATAPLAIPSLNVAGLAFAYSRDVRDGEDGPRVAVSFIGEGGTSLGEWHEAINLAAARRLPAIFCIQDNGTALSTPVDEQSAVRTFADKAAGYGLPGITLDGTDPEAIAAAFAWAAERARAGFGPTLIELVCLRLCGHAHHDDMLYLGRDPQLGWDIPELTGSGYADPDAYRYWAERDPIVQYAARLESQGVATADEVEAMKTEVLELVEREARAVIEAPWPDATQVGHRVYRDGAPARHREPLEERPAVSVREIPDLPAVTPGLPHDPKGSTFLDAVMRGVGDALAGDPRVFVYGEDVGGDYGNAFLLLRPLLEEYGDRIVNSPIAEAGVLGLATGFNQLVNNTAKVHYRWGGSVPLVVRMPWGGLRKAGPYHSQNTEGWFYRTPGLKIVAPSTPEDARAMLAAAVADPDPVLYYEHIALYRDPKIKQLLPDEAPEPTPLGKAALRRAGSDLAIVSYGAFVHRALAVASRLAEDGIEASVLDLRSLVPLDRETLLAVARHTGKVLIVQEDTRTGSVGESLAAILQEEIFEYLDAPVRIVGSLDTPVPYAPPLEEAFLPSEERIERAARLLVDY
jgi:2-oxoisovalerate dehydrogenase E1 component